MKKLFLLIAAVTALKALSQQPCGTPDFTAAQEMQRKNLLEAIKSSETYRLGGGIIYVPLKMHLVGLDDNTGYVTRATLNDGIAELNSKFQPVGIEFYFSGTDFNYYPNTLIYNAEQTAAQLSDFQSAAMVGNAMNIFMSNTVKLGTTLVGGYSPVTPTYAGGNYVWMANYGFNNNRTGVHEFGHFFGLAHTFNNSQDADINLRELVTRNFSEPSPRISANCETAGDYVCDTPSDPYDGTVSAITGCEYTDTITDANGDLFTPDVLNYMSYYFCNPPYFSPGQIERMADGAIIVTSTSNGFSLDASETPQNTPGGLTATSNGDYAGDISLSWSDNSDVETGYIIERSVSADGPFIAVAGVGPDTVNLGNAPTEPGMNFYRIKPSNSKNNYSAVSDGVLSSSLCANDFGQSCDLAADPALAAWRIERFALSNSGTTLFDNEDSGCSEGGIGNYFHTYAAAIVPGQTLDFIVESKTGTDGGYNILSKLWVDWNRDNDFDDSGETVFTSTTSTWAQASGSFVIPGSLPVGDFRLRVAITAADQAPTPCGAYFGEIEDYKLTNSTLSEAQFRNDRNFQISPNPVTTHLSIKSDLEVSHVTVTDVTGKMIMDVHGKIQVIDTEELSPGIYFLRAYADEQIFTEKFIRE